MKRILPLLLSLLTLSASAQLYNNEWIDYNKTYYKFKFRHTNIVRITESTLTAIGIGGTNADHFQLWRNGREVPIYTSAQNAPLGSGGYIEFFGEMNDGSPDNVMFRQAEYQLSDKYSLQSDTVSYFLTVNPAGNNARVVTTVNDLANNTLSPEPFFMHTEGTYYRNKINNGRAELVGDSYTYSSSYDEGEGWSSNDISNGASLFFAYTNMRPYLGAGAPDATFRVNAAGNAVHARYFRVKLNGDSLYGHQLDYYDMVKGSVAFPVSKINSGTASFELTNMGNSPSDRMVVGQTEVTYPRQFNFNNAQSFIFTLPANPAGNYLEIAGFNHNTVPPVLMDVTNGKRYVCDISNPALVRVVLQPSATERKLILINQVFDWMTKIQPQDIVTKNFVNYADPSRQGDFMIITSKYLIDGPGGDPVEDYRQYRASPEGGSYTSRVYLIDELVDQFGFGINMHPLSIRNFLRWARANYTAQPKTVLLIGKGVQYPLFRTYEGFADMAKLQLVPTFGYPASDNLLSAAGSSSVPLTPIGRVSAINKNEITVYLNKVKQYEQAQTVSSPAIEEKAWMKNIVHVVGAGDNNTSNLLYNALEGHRRIIEDTFYAGKVHTFTKNSADAVQQVSSARLANLFNAGIGILTYFGHSSSSSLEFNLDDPQNYNNAGKYPVFIVMGCNAGSFYGFNSARLSIKETLSEKYVLAPERGSVAFMASTHLGIIHYLDIYNTRTYRAASTTHYGATLGEIMDESIRKVFGLTTENDFYARFQCEQFTLHGDPALKLHHFEKPDYVIEEPMVKVSPAIITVSATDFKVTARFNNIGKSLNKDIVVEMKRTYPSLVTEVIRRDTIRFTKFEDSLTYVLPLVASRDKGLNKITITLDADNTIDELYETNNTVTKDIYVIDNDAKPVYPYNYSIVNDPNVKLVASSADPFAQVRQYLMEMDTTELFNSPVKVSRSVTTNGGVIEFTHGATLQDSMVYYWRVAPAVTTGEPRWNSYSFQYIANGHAGFSQAHYYQHLQSTGDRIELKEDREWHFKPITNNLFVKNGVWASAITQESEIVVNVNDSSYIRSACNFGFIVNVFDKKTFQPWKNQVVGGGGLYNSNYPGCFASRIWNFEFSNNEAGRNNMKNFLRNVVPDGDYVVVRFLMLNNAVNQYAPRWKDDELTYGVGNSMYSELKTQGFAKIDSIDRPRVFNFVYKKNDADTHAPQYIYSQCYLDPIHLSVDCVSPDSVGLITSPVIGKAKAWYQLHWRGKKIDPTDGDIPNVDIYGINAEGAEELVMPNLSFAQQDHDISSINAQQYHSLVLKMRNVDSTHYTPYQLRYWMVTYDPVPEGAVAPNLYFTTRDTVEVGEPFNFGIAFKNISNYKFDSIKVKLAITDRNNIENIIPVPRQKDLQPGDTIKINVPVDTRSLSGHNTLFVNFNPDNDQPEEYLFNNFGFRNLYVRPDSLNPLLDVTFDGVHILNRDIISSKPDILIKLKDEAKWMMLNDTSLFSLQVKYPDNSVRRFHFDNNSDTLQFIPAGQAPNTDNTASVNFSPYFPQDGEYELQVTGKDRSENSAGAVKYRVSFQVINKPMISNMLNYPNPFTTSTAFVFTITGSEVPQSLRIQILTVTGKIVREITTSELGPLHIGRNITEYKWDGTDQYGQKLANGIYLYRVITNLNGKTLEKYKAQGDNTDQFFNKGYGKMYLMR